MTMDMTTSNLILIKLSIYRDYTVIDNCLYRPAIRRKQKLETTYDPQREISRMRANEVRVSKSAQTLKTPLVLVSLTVHFFESL
jgi:hypothetical protein